MENNERVCCSSLLIRFAFNGQNELSIKQPFVLASVNNTGIFDSWRFPATINELEINHKPLTP